MKYEDMSDFEINKLVAIEDGIDIPVIDGVWNIIDGNIAVATDPNGGLSRRSLFNDFCNNPSHAWPIILEYKIDITFLKAETGIVLASNGDFYARSKNPLRSAMICFLKMKSH